MPRYLFVCLLVVLVSPGTVLPNRLPAFIGTWPFSVNVLDSGWEVLQQGGSLLDAVELGISNVCETNVCDRSVGAYGKVDEDGRASLDSLIMDGKTMRAGAVGNLKNVKEGIRVARAVMKYTRSTFLAGAEVTKFATDMGFKLSNLTNNFTDTLSEFWRNNSCQPNFRENVQPDPRSNCGPYRPAPETRLLVEPRELDDDDHDTICMIGVDAQGNVVTGTSTNGLDFKVPGRVGDTPVVGAGGFADNEAGGAAAMGNGDIILRFLPSYQAVESMRRGMSPSDAAADAIRRILRHEPTFSGALIVMSKTGEHGAACSNRRSGRFVYSIRTDQMTQSQTPNITCIDSNNIGTTTPQAGGASSPFRFLLLPFAVTIAITVANI